MTVNWYQNSVNSTTGGTLVNSSSRTSTTNSSGSLSYRPSTATTGVSYYYCVITWTGTGTCNTSGTLTSSTTQVTISAAPGTIGGSNTPCVAAATTYTNSATGGTWSSSSTSRATIGLTTGVLNGVSAGTVYITYRSTCGSRVTKLLTVTATPTVASISGGTSKVCTGSTTTLTNSTSGGVWSSSNTAVGTVSTSGVVRGISAGITTISYEVSNACGTVYATKDVTVTATPAAISGVSSTCAGYTTLYSNTVPYGNWTSSNTSRATINATTGLITAVSAGTTLISYSTGCGAMATKALTVNAGVAANTGTPSVCEGATTTLSNSAAGGAWSTADGSIATVGSTTGVVTGVSEGTTSITYSTGGSCNAVTTVTVKATPAVISGSSTVCTGGGTTLFSNSTLYGTWSSSTPSVATINTNSGLATGMVQGTTRITYTTGCGTPATKLLTVYTQPASITGTASVCAGATTTLSNATSGGTWSSSDETEATVNASGVVTGVSAGMLTITYTNGTCYSTRSVTVNPLADAGTLSGDFSVCDGDDLAFSSDGDAGGTWTSSNTSVATVDASGDGTANAPGTATISYSVSNGCGTVRATSVVTVSADPAVGTLSGAATVCEASTTTYTATGSSDAGAWSSSNSAIATVGTTGVVSGVAPGTSSILYTVTNGCGSAVDSVVVTVNPLPSAGTITGTATVCETATTTLSNSVTGGTWSSSNAAVATVGTNGVVTGVAAGNTTISYAYTNSCGTAYTTQVVTVNPLPSAGTVSGSAVVCEEATTTLASTVGGGVWSSANAAVATVGTNGVVTGVAAGNATISYAYTNSCGTAYATQVVTVNPLPAAGTITGTAVVCEASTTALSNSVTGGTWSSSNTAVATIGTDGVVTGVAAGNAIISYSYSNSCGTAVATNIVTVNALPNAGAISGSSSVCLSSTTDLTNAVSGGVWSSSNTGVATVSTTGVVTGVAVGTATITYTHTTSCGSAFVTHDVTVNTVPSFASITGANTVCASSSTTLSNSVAGGAWSSANDAVATVGTDGTVTGVAAGTATISYGASNACGSNYASVVVTVNPSSATITGSASVCLGGTTTFTVSDPAGAWSSSSPAVASIGSATGEVNGLTIGSVTVSYTATSGCYVATQILNVYNSVGEITGTVFACEGVTSALSCATAGGSWSTNNASIASIDASGIVTAVSAGSAVVTYTVAGGCYTTTPFVVWPMPAAITGTNTVCTGSSTVLYSTIGGSGTWSSSDVTVATADLTSGMINGLVSGTATITYRIPASGCQVTSVVTVNETPAAITGSNTICVGSTSVYSSATTGGAWSSNPSSVATIDDTSGLANAATAGVTTISYVMPTGCRTTKVITVNPLPASITYAANNVCLGKTMTFASATTGGTWSSSNTTVATIVASNGVATTQDLGTTNIIYTLPTGCTKSTTFTVYSGVSSIAGSDMVAKGTSITLTNATAGGTWSSGNTSVISANSVTGVVTGMSAGSARISYKLLGGCLAYKVMTVAGITGTPRVCAASTTTLSHLMSGTWSSANTAIATVDAATGVVTGVAPGNAVISYNLGGGVVNTITVVVYALPASITGSSAICADASALYTGTVGGSGTWSSSDVSVVTIGSTSGMATGIAAGTSVLTYRIPSSGCFTTRAVSVNPAPAAITGSPTACVGSTVTLSNSVEGGVWSSNPTTVATVGSTTGVVTAASAGGVTISYTLSNGCRKTRVITVNASPAAISGPAVLSPGSASAFSCGSAGGSWSVSDESVASVLTASGTSANVRGNGHGTAQVWYRLANGCGRSKDVNVVGAKSAPVAEEVVENLFNVYPNPTSGVINVTSSVAGSFAVYTFDGKQVGEYQIGTNTNTVNLPSGLAAGVYICQFRFEDGTSKTVKLFYQN